MQTHVFFDNSQTFFFKRLKEASTSIHLVTQGMPAPGILTILHHKATSGTTVNLIFLENDHLPSPSQDLIKLKEVSKNCIHTVDTTGNTLFQRTLCLIDKETLIIAPQQCLKEPASHPLLTTVKDLPELIHFFYNQFTQTVDKLSQPPAIEPDHSQILPRLKTLRLMIQLQDEEDINNQLRKLQEHLFDDESFRYLWEIVGHIKDTRHPQALEAIEGYLNNYSTYMPTLSTFDQNCLKLELKIVETQLNSLENEKMEVEKLLLTYQHRHSREVGDIIKKILLIRKERLKQKTAQNKSRKNEYREAKSDYEEFCSDHKKTIDQKLLQISEEEKQELKTLFRASSKMCHPDMVSPEFKSQAKKLFAKLCEANQENDLSQVKAIHHQLELGILATASTQDHDPEALQELISILTGKINDITGILYARKTSDIYKQIHAITDWDNYFRELKQQLHDTLKNIEANPE